MGCADSREALCKGIEAGVSSTNIGQLATDCGDVNFLNKGGDSPLHLCVLYDAPIIAELLLAHHNATVDIADSNGRPPLYTACLGGRMDVVQVLIRHHAAINATGPSGHTALMGAAWRGHVAIVQLLLQHGAMIDARTNENKTALSLATEWSHQPVVDVLTAAGARPIPSSSSLSVTTSDHIAISVT